MKRSSDPVHLAVLLGALLLGCGGEEVRNGEDSHKSHTHAATGNDFWLERYEAYFTPQQKEAYLATPEGQRLRVHGDLLLDFKQREDLLRPAEGRLTREQAAAYRALPDLDACREFLRPYVEVGQE